jgi:hypothetical protein
MASIVVRELPNVIHQRAHNPTTNKYIINRTFANASASFAGPRLTLPFRRLCIYTYHGDFYSFTSGPEE